MSILFLNYPKCSTCAKAKKWLDDNNITYTNRHIVEQNPTKDELQYFIELSGLEPKKFFNTSGILYRELNLKDKLITATKDEMIDILSTNGMLIKRPLIIGEKGVLIGKT